MTNQDAIEALGRAIEASTAFAQVVSGFTGVPIAGNPAAWVFASGSKEDTWSGFAGEERIRVLAFEVLISARPRDLPPTQTVEAIVGAVISAIESKPLLRENLTPWPESYGPLTIIAEAKFPRFSASTAKAVQSENPATVLRVLTGSVAFDV